MKLEEAAKYLEQGKKIKIYFGIGKIKINDKYHITQGFEDFETFQKFIEPFKQKFYLTEIEIEV